MVNRINGVAKVEEAMTREVLKVRHDTTIKELVELFNHYDYNALPVADELGDLKGIVTKLDLLKAFVLGRRFNKSDLLRLNSETVADIMRRSVITVSPSDTVQTAAEYMVEFKLRSLPVTSEGKLVGIISRKDVVRFLNVD